MKAGKYKICTDNTPLILLRDPQLLKTYFIYLQEKFEKSFAVGMQKEESSV